MLPQVGGANKYTNENGIFDLAMNGDATKAEYIAASISYQQHTSVMHFGQKILI